MAQFLDKFKVIDDDLEQPERSYDLGVDFNHVYKIVEEDNTIKVWSLTKFFEKIQEFFSKPIFMSYSKQTPNGVNSIMECYIAESDDNSLDSRIKNINN